MAAFLVEICGPNMGRQYDCDTLEQAQLIASAYSQCFDVYINDEQVSNGAEKQEKAAAAEESAYDFVDRMIRKHGTCES
jgi:hypothetical protein